MQRKFEVIRQIDTLNSVAIPHLAGINATLENETRIIP
jgi:hypothetical protein